MTRPGHLRDVSPQVSAQTDGSVLAKVGEAPEFSGKALDALRQPLESGHVVVARAAGVVRLPARFLMVQACARLVIDRVAVRSAGVERRSLVSALQLARLTPA